MDPAASVALLTLLLAIEGTPAPAPRPTPSRPGLSWDDADSLSRKLEAIEKRVPSEKRAPGDKPTPSKKRSRDAPTAPADHVVVTQAELNSYLNLSLGPKIPEGLSDVDFQIDQDRLTARALVDLGRVKAKLGKTSPYSPIALLSGTVPVEIRGRVPNANGFGSFDFEDIRLGGFSVPASLLGQIVASATRTPENPEGFDIQAHFRLPYSLKRVRMQPGTLVLEP